MRVNAVNELSSLDPYLHRAARHVARGLSRRDTLVLGGAAAAGLAIASSPARAVTVDITQGNVQPMPIAIPDFLGGTPADNETAHGVSQIITNNLKRSGLFAPLDPAAFLEKITSVDAVPRFPDWRTINAQALAIGRITRQPDGRLKAEFRLWDVLAGQQLAGQQYFTTPDNWRRIAHIISDAIYERLTGDKGYFDTRIVFVDETGPAERRIKRLAIMDQDGANVRYLTRGDELVLTPRFSPSTQEITYMAYGAGDPRVYLLNIETGQREIVGNFPGMSFSPRFSPDGQRVVMSLQEGSNSNIFVMDLRSKAMTRLTDTAAIDTAPSYSPDGARICFEFGPRRSSTSLHHGGVRRGGAADQLRRRFLFDAGVVAARRLHRLHPAGRRQIRHRRDEAGRQRRARADGRLPQRGADLRAQRPGDHVLPRSGWQRRAVALHHRHRRPQRAQRTDPELCFRPGLVTATFVSVCRRLRRFRATCRVPITLPHSRPINHNGSFRGDRWVRSFFATLHQG